MMILAYNPVENGERLKKLRLNAGLKIEAVAAGCDISASALALYESGERNPRDDIKINLANFFKVTVQDIFYPQKIHSK